MGLSKYRNGPNGAVMAVAVFTHTDFELFLNFCVVCNDS